MESSPKYCVVDLNAALSELFKALASDERPVARLLNDWLGEEVSLDEAVKCLTTEEDVILEIALHAKSIEEEYGRAFGLATKVFCEALFKKFKAMDLYREGKLIGAPLKWYGPFLILELKCKSLPISTYIPQQSYGNSFGYLEKPRLYVTQ